MYNLSIQWMLNIKFATKETAQTDENANDSNSLLLANP